MYGLVNVWMGVIIKMLCDPISHYPEKIDDMTFFQDASLDNIEIIKHYNALITEGKYNEANEYINQQEGIYGYFADFFNLIENRIYSLQEYLLTKPPKNQPFIFYNKKGYGIHIFSDTDEIEDLSIIKLFSPDETEFMDLETLYAFDNEKEIPEKLQIYIDDTEMELDEIEPPVITEDTIWI